METLYEDISCYLRPPGLDLKSIKLDESDLENFYNVNISPGGHSSTEKFRKKYFGQLSKKEMILFYERYKIDFLLHGYRIESFFPYASDFDNDSVPPIE